MLGKLLPNHHASRIWHTIIFLSAKPRPSSHALVRSDKGTVAAKKIRTGVDEISPGLA